MRKRDGIVLRARGNISPQDLNVVLELFEWSSDGYIESVNTLTEFRERYFILDEGESEPW
jgi:hypothetical protein